MMVFRTGGERDENDDRPGEGIPNDYPIPSRNPEKDPTPIPVDEPSDPAIPGPIQAPIREPNRKPKIRVLNNEKLM